MSQADSEPITAETFAAFASWLGTPLPEDPIRALRILRREAAAEIERLLTFLDALSGDADLEDTSDEEADLGWSERYGQGSRVTASNAISMQYHPDSELDPADEEPSLGFLERHPGLWESGSQLAGSIGNSKDLEGERVGEDDEDSDASGIGDMGGYSEQLNGEPSLGATEAFSHLQAWRAQEDTWHAEDGEPDLASTPIDDATGKHKPTRIGNLDEENAMPPSVAYAKRLKARRPHRRTEHGFHNLVGLDGQPVKLLRPF